MNRILREGGLSTGKGESIDCGLRKVLAVDGPDEKNVRCGAEETVEVSHRRLGSHLIDDWDLPAVKIDQDRAISGLLLRKGKVRRDPLGQLCDRNLVVGRGRQDLAHRIRKETREPILRTRSYRPLACPEETSACPGPPRSPLPEPF